MTTGRLLLRPSGATSVPWRGIFLWQDTNSQITPDGGGGGPSTVQLSFDGTPIDRGGYQFGNLAKVPTGLGGDYEIIGEALFGAGPATLNIVQCRLVLKINGVSVRDLGFQLYNNGTQVGYVWNDWKTITKVITLSAGDTVGIEAGGSSPSGAPGGPITVGVADGSLFVRFLGSS